MIARRLTPPWYLFAAPGLYVSARATGPQGVPDVLVFEPPAGIVCWRWRGGGFRPGLPTVGETMVLACLVLQGYFLWILVLIGLSLVYWAVVQPGRMGYLCFPALLAATLGLVPLVLASQFLLAIYGGLALLMILAMALIGRGVRSRFVLGMLAAGCDLILLLVVAVTCEGLGSPVVP